MSPRGRWARRIWPGDFYQDHDGKWWLLSQQHGFVRANTNGRAFRFYLRMALAARYGLARGHYAMEAA